MNDALTERGQPGLNHSGSVAREIVDWVVGRGRILIVAHDNPDPDSLATAFALRHLFLVKGGKEATIAFGGVIGRGENRAMVHELEIDAVPIDSLDLDSFDVVCLVDTQPGAGNNSFPVDRKVDVVIDHHPAQAGADRSRWVDIRSGYGACATILFEYLLCQEVYISTKLATILFYAIKSETQDLGREWSRADREAYLHLLRRANNSILYNITHPKASRGYFRYFNKALENARIHGRALVFNLHHIDNPDMVSEMADFLLRTEEVEVTLGMGLCRGKVIISMRTSDQELNAGEVIQSLLAGMGTAGGHGMIAGGQIPSVAGELPELDTIEARLTERLLQVLSIPLSPGSRLIED